MAAFNLSHEFQWPRYLGQDGPLCLPKYSLLSAFWCHRARIHSTALRRELHVWRPLIRLHSRDDIVVVRPTASAPARILLGHRRPLTTAFRVSLPVPLCIYSSISPSVCQRKIFALFAWKMMGNNLPTMLSLVPSPARKTKSKWVVNVRLTWPFGVPYQW